MLIGLSMFQNLLWVYGMAWMSVRFPGLKFCPSPPLPVCECDLLMFLTRAEQNVTLGTADPFQLCESHSPAESAVSLCLNELSE